MKKKLNNHFMNAREAKKIADSTNSINAKEKEFKEILDEITRQAKDGRYKLITTKTEHFESIKEKLIKDGFVIEHFTNIKFYSISWDNSVQNQ